MVIKKNIILAVIVLLLSSIFVYAQDNEAEENTEDPADLNNILGDPDTRFEEVPTNFQNIDLYSGQMSESISLVNLKGRNGMDFSLGLGYSTNFDAEKENKEQPTSWLGLGFGIGFGSVTAETKGTADFNDDIFYLNNEKLIRIPGQTNKYEIKYKLKNYRYIDITRIADKKTNKITEWIVTNEDGSKTIYGSNDNAISYMISRWGWIGNVFNGETDLTPYAWHIYKQKDLFGNEIKFEYDKIEEYLKSGSWQSTYPYTKAVYLKKITDSIGREIIFNTKDKIKDEYYDPYDFPEPDSYMEFYEDKYLDNIIIKNTDGNDFQKIEFEYELKGAGQFTKRLLKSVTTSFFNNNRWNALPKTEFFYYPKEYLDSKKSYALQKIKHPTGGTTEYGYQEKELEYTQLDNSLQTASETDVTYLGNNYMIVKHGTIKNYGSVGYETYLKKYVESTKLSVYNWDGHKWWKAEDFIVDEENIQNVQIYTGPDYFAARVISKQDKIEYNPLTMALPKGTIKIYQRQGDKWEQGATIEYGKVFDWHDLEDWDQSKVKAQVEREPKIWTFENTIMVSSGNHPYWSPSVFVDKIAFNNLQIYQKHISEQNKVYWMSTQEIEFKGTIQATSNYFILEKYVDDLEKQYYGRKKLEGIDVYTLQHGMIWDLTDEIDCFEVTAIGNDYFILDGSKVYEHDGANWKHTQTIDTVPHDYQAVIAAGTNFMVIGYKGLFGGYDVYLYERDNNHKWKGRTILDNIPENQKVYDVSTNNKYIGIITRKSPGSQNYEDFYYTIFNKINGKWVKKVENQLIVKNTRTNPDPLKESINKDVHIIFGDSLYTVTYFDMRSKQDPVEPSFMNHYVSGITKAYYYDGDNWIYLDEEKIFMNLFGFNTGKHIFTQNPLDYYYGFLNPDVYYDTIRLTKPEIVVNPVSSGGNSGEPDMPTFDVILANTPSSDFPTGTNFYKSVKYQAKGKAKVYPIREKKINDGFGNIIKYKFDYDYGKMDPTLNTAQFGKAEVLIPGDVSGVPGDSGKIVNYFYNGLSSEDGSQFPAKLANFRKLNGLMYKSEIYDSQNNIIAESADGYEVVDRGQASFLVRNTRSVNSIEGDLNNGVVTVAETEYNDDNGLPKKTTIYDKNKPDKKIITETTYAFDQYPDETIKNEMKNLNMLSQPYEMKIKDKNNNLLSAAKTEYEEMQGVYVPYKASAWKDDRYIKTNEIKEIDRYGNVKKTEDPEGNIQDIRYDAVVSAFPVKGWNSVIGSESNPAWEIVYKKDWLVDKTYGANREETQFKYDEYNRPKKVYMPKDLGKTPTIEYEYKFWSNSENPNKVTTTQKIDNGFSVSHVYADGLGRAHQANAESDDNEDIVVINDFNKRGLEEKNYKPRKKTGADSSKFMPVSAKIQFIGDEKFIKKEYEPDPLARVSKIYSYDDSFSEMEYSNENNEKVVLTKDANGHYTRSTYDAFSNLIKVKENSIDGINFLYTITYTYDILNRLLTITDARDHVTTNVYDTLGQLKTTIHPDTGKTEFAYDNNGNLIKKTDARGITIQYHYDKLNRLKKVDYPPNDYDSRTELYPGIPTTTDTIRTYDNCLNGKGRLCHVMDSSGEMIFKYDKNGNVIEERKRIINADMGIDKEFTIQYEYDSAGNLIELKGPEGSVLIYNYNQLNQLENIKKDNVQIASFDYIDTGAIDWLKYYKPDASLLSTTDYTYNTNEWLKTLNLDSTNNLNFDFERYYEYDKIGNIDKLREGLSAGSTLLADFGYDPVDRLTNVLDNNYYGENIEFTYDATGNRLTRNAVTYAYHQNRNWLLNDGSCDYTYDANGNTARTVCEGTATSYYYDEENRLIKVIIVKENDWVENKYVYDMNGLRAIKEDSQRITLYIYDMAGNNIFEEKVEPTSISTTPTGRVVKEIPSKVSRCKWWDILCWFR